MKVAIYPGSFDPITLGHLDIIRRAARCFDKVYVCVLYNCDKKTPMFSPEERLEMIRRSVAEIPNVEAELFSGLLADYAREKKASILVKGVRNATDFDLEYQMAAINLRILLTRYLGLPASLSTLISIASKSCLFHRHLVRSPFIATNQSSNTFLASQGGVFSYHSIRKR